MVKLVYELLVDLEKEIVDWVFNYDGIEQILVVMLIKIFNLLVNGFSGIVVGMVINILLYNFGEVIDGCLVLMDNFDLIVDELMQYIFGLDFFIVGIINGCVGIIEVYCIGCGCIYICVCVVVEEMEKGGGCEQIIIIELLYQLNKVWLIEKIVELVKEKKIEGIFELCDEFDKDGMCVVIELCCGEVGEVVFNNFYVQIQLQSVFGINVVVLVDGQLCMLNLKDMFEVFVCYCCEVVIWCIVYELCKVCECGYILEGQVVVLLNIDLVIELIKSLLILVEVKECLIVIVWEFSVVEVMVECVGVDVCCLEDLDLQYGLCDGKYYLLLEQVQVIFELCLYCLIGLEYEKLFFEYQEIFNLIGELICILINLVCLMEVICEELEVVKVEFGDVCCIEIVVFQVDLIIVDLIIEEDCVVIIFYGGYVKFQLLVVYQVQCCGGKGKFVIGMKDEDYIEYLLVVNSYVIFLLFFSKGKVYWLCIFEILEVLCIVCGWLLVNLLLLDEGEWIIVMLQIDLEVLQQNGGVDDDFDEVEGVVFEGEVVEVVEVEEVEGEIVELVVELIGVYIFMVIVFGIVKKILLVQFSCLCSSGLIVFKLEEGDILIVVVIIDGVKEVMLFFSVGKVICFVESVVCIMGCNVCGVCGMCLGKGQQLIFMLILEFGVQIFIVFECGFGKCILLSKFLCCGCGGQGVIVMVINECNGVLIVVVQVQEGEEIMLIFDQGILVWMCVDEVFLFGCNIQGVILIKFVSDEVLVGLECVQELLGGDDEDLFEGEEVVEFLGELVEFEFEFVVEVEGNEE